MPCASTLWLSFRAGRRHHHMIGSRRSSQCSRAAVSRWIGLQTRGDARASATSVAGAVEQSADDLDQLRGVRRLKLRERRIHRLGELFRNHASAQTSHEQDRGSLDARGADPDDRVLTGDRLHVGRKQVSKSRDRSSHRHVAVLTAPIRRARSSARTVRRAPSPATRRSPS